MSSIASPLRGGEMPTRLHPVVPVRPAVMRWRRRGLIVLASILASLSADLVFSTLLSSPSVQKWSGLPDRLAGAITDLSPELLALAAGFLCALCGIAFASAFRSRAGRRFLHAEEIEAATDLTVLATLPELPGTDSAFHQSLRDAASPYARGLRTLHAQLLATSQPGIPLTVAVASTTIEEGRSTLAASLGRFLASEGHRVLLIDCDWRHPDQHHLFRVPHDGGLTRLLERRSQQLDDAIHTDPLSGLDFVTTGRGGRLSARMLLSEPMRQALAGFLRCYELVILDLPPVQAAGEVLLLARLVDRILFVVRWRHVGRSRAMATLTRLRKARGQVAGIVLTRVTASLPADRPTARFDAAQHQPTTE